MLGMRKQPLPLSAEKRETNANYQDGKSDADKGEADCCAGWEAGGQSGWRGKKKRWVILCNSSSEVSECFTRHAFNVRKFCQFQANTTEGGLTCIRNRIRVKLVSSLVNMLEDLFEGLCKLNGSEQKLRVGFAIIDIGNEFQLSLFKRECTAATGPDQANLTCRRRNRKTSTTIVFRLKIFITRGYMIHAIS